MADTNDNIQVVKIVADTSGVKQPLSDASKQVNGLTNDAGKA